MGVKCALIRKSDLWNDLLRKVFLKNGNFISYFCRIHGKIWNMALLKKVAPRVLPFSDKK